MTRPWRWFSESDEKESRKTARAEKPQGKVQRVWDDRGAVYELGEKLAEGAQVITDQRSGAAR